MRILKSKPIVKGAQDSGSKKAIYSKFDFLAEGVKGEYAGGGYYMAELPLLSHFCKSL